MNSLASVVPSLGPLPIIHRQYRSIAASPRGRLSARAELDGTLCLQFYPREARSGRRPVFGGWRAGPLRTCHLVFEALSHGLLLLGEQPSQERSLQLSRLIDRPLAQRLRQYVFLNDGEYAHLLPEVTFAEPSHTPPDSPLPPSIAWLATSVVGMTSRPREEAERETFVLVKQQKRWELWARMERANSGSMPCRRHQYLCSTELLAEEPALAAELLTYATLAQSRRVVQLASAPAALIAPARLAIIEQRLRIHAGARGFQPVNS